MAGGHRCDPVIVIRGPSTNEQGRAGASPPCALRRVMAGPHDARAEQSAMSALALTLTAGQGGRLCVNRRTESWVRSREEAREDVAQDRIEDDGAGARSRRRRRRARCWIYGRNERSAA